MAKPLRPTVFAKPDSESISHRSSEWPPESGPQVKGLRETIENAESTLEGAEAFLERAAAEAANDVAAESGLARKAAQVANDVEALSKVDAEERTTREDLATLEARIREETHQLFDGNENRRAKFVTGLETPRSPVATVALPKVSEAPAPQWMSADRKAEVSPEEDSSQIEDIEKFQHVSRGFVTGREVPLAVELPRVKEAESAPLPEANWETVPFDDEKKTESEIVVSSEPAELEPDWTFTPPESREELTELDSERAKKQERLRTLEAIPPAQLSKHDSLRMDILRNEIAIMERYARRFEISAYIQTQESKLMGLDEQLVQLLKAAPVNDIDVKDLSAADRLDALIGTLPFQDQVAARRIVEEQRSLQTEIAGDRRRVAEITTALIGLDRLLLQKRELLKKAPVVKKEEEAPATYPVFSAPAGDKKTKTSWGRAGAFVLAAGGFFGIAKFAGWIDRKLGEWFHGDSADKLAALWNKLTFGNKSQKPKEKHE